MTFNPDKYHRRSIRLKGFDYSSPGAYFITICTQNRMCLFGKIIDRQMVLNEAGQMVQIVWDKIPEHYLGIEKDEFVVMPNHIHGIIIIVGVAPCGRPNNGRVHPVLRQPRGVAPTLSLPDVVHRFKTMTTKRYADGVKQNGWPPFPGRLWQRNYYEHIIRLSASGYAQADNENELDRIQKYIKNNPIKWDVDRENPSVSILETPHREGIK